VSSRTLSPSISELASEEESIYGQMVYILFWLETWLTPLRRRGFGAFESACLMIEVS
jgi:hypothetical protein